MAEAETLGGAGPALAAHSKDGAAPGQTPASSATGQPRRARGGGADAALSNVTGQVESFVRGQPVLAAAVAGILGLMIGRILGGR